MWNAFYTKEYGWIEYDSLQNFTSFLSGYITPSIIAGNEKIRKIFYGGKLKDLKFSINFIK